MANTTINVTLPKDLDFGSNRKPQGGASYFDGGLLELIGLYLLGAIITALTAGICYPWSLVIIYRWKIEHTVIEGHRLRFEGTAVGLFGSWIKWFLLGIVTFGIYFFWAGIKLEQWKTKHTYFR
ncbi:membrane protein [Paenibacillus chitinolyticus]|uniref:DUF898 family protein n=1 Tax=Paenibacillus chitinolyticus TaxID=79263 RepID=UPI0026E4F857|nr:DUF898 family protein [Paenibacillus chitinolyticus]GKS12162.1 membrane protein [Paenibacillus chitinolyticus]